MSEGLAMDDPTTIDGPEAEPPQIEAPVEHPKWPAIRAALRTVYDPEIPVNIYELGLIYRVDVGEGDAVSVLMSLTAPGCPVAGEMPGQVQEALAGVEGIGPVSVDLVWDPSWNPTMMAETAKMQLGMF